MMSVTLSASSFLGIYHSRQIVSSPKAVCTGQAKGRAAILGLLAELSNIPWSLDLQPWVHMVLKLSTQRQQLCLMGTKQPSTMLLTPGRYNVRPFKPVLLAVICLDAAHIT